MVDTGRVSVAVSEVATVEGLPPVAARVYGYTSARCPRADVSADVDAEPSEGKTHCLCVVTELCEEGNLEDFMEAEGAPLSPAVKLDIMLQVATGLEQLKAGRAFCGTKAHGPRSSTLHPSHPLKMTLLFSCHDNN